MPRLDPRPKTSPSATGLPPHGAGGTRCSSCHRNVVDAPDQPGSGANLHLNGTVDFCDANTPANTCHGSAASPAPLPIYQGNSIPGGHRGGAAPAALVTPPARHSWPHPVLGVPSGSGQTCLAPAISAQVTRPAQSQARVFNVPGSGTLARARGARYGSQSGDLLGAYCHGGVSAQHRTGPRASSRSPTGSHPTAARVGRASHQVFGTPDRGNTNRVCRLPRQHHRLCRKHHLFQRVGSPDHDPHERSLRCD